MEENGSKRVEQAANNSVKLKLVSNKDGKEIHVLVKRNVKLKTVLRGFALHASLDYRSTRFVINHQGFSHKKTPNQLGLQDEDQIDALIDGNGA